MPGEDMREIAIWIADERFIYDMLDGFPSILVLLLIVLCIVVVSKGADWLVEGAVRLAGATGLSRIFIGATVVSLGTTTPEAVVSVMAAWMGNPGLALGNGVGSIIADTGLIFGLSCILASMPVNRYILNRTGWVQVGSATLLVIIALIAAAGTGPPVIGRSVGLLFLCILTGYLYMTYVWAKRGAPTDEGTAECSAAGGLAWSWSRIVAGLVMVVAGARILVPCVSCMAHRVGVPDDVIAATLVAFGTSLPELITAVAAIRKGHPEITIGNIVGADVLNCLFVIGAAAAARPLAIPENFYTFHFPAMLLILYSFRIFIGMNRQGRFRKWQGGWLLGVYFVYILLQYLFNIEA